jgi:hypothetical protein
MENFRIFLIAIVVFAGFALLLWKLTSKEAKTEYGTKLWKHWPTRLSYYQGLILYSTGLTLLSLFLLKWINLITW